MNEYNFENKLIIVTFFFLWHNIKIEILINYHLFIQLLLKIYRLTNHYSRLYKYSIVLYNRVPSAL